ncbi:Histone acetyltransferase GCN5, partial [Fusarium oxysporum f. sp. albedinis]
PLTQNMSSQSLMCNYGPQRLPGRSLNLQPLGLQGPQRQY